MLATPAGFEPATFSLERCCFWSALKFANLQNSYCGSMVDSGRRKLANLMILWAHHFPLGSANKINGLLICVSSFPKFWGVFGE